MSEAAKAVRAATVRRGAADMGDEVSRGPLGCAIDALSSGGCSRGTHGCVVDHELKQAHYDWQRERDSLLARLAAADLVVDAARATVCAWRTDERCPLRLEELAAAVDAAGFPGTAAFDAGAINRGNGQSVNCSHGPDPCPIECACYCNGCTVERLVAERDALRRLSLAEKKV
jgi:hypothetical protein